MKPEREVTKDEFKRLYFDLGGGKRTGWDAERWQSRYEKAVSPEMKYFAREPETPAHTRMFIATDYRAKRYRLFFLTEDQEEAFFDYPGKP